MPQCNYCHRETQGVQLTPGAVSNVCPECAKAHGLKVSAEVKPPQPARKKTK